MVFGNLFSEKRIFRSVQSIVVGIVVCLVLLVSNATANAGTYFGQSPSANTIVELLRDSSGNIIAIDHQGNVMRFDYFQWTTIKGNPGFENNISHTFSYYDKAINKVVITQSNYYLIIGVYNVNTNNYDLFQVLGYPYICSSGNKAFAFIRNGELYLISHTGYNGTTGQAKLYKFNGNSWIEISTGPSIRSPQGANSYYYDQLSDCVLAVYKAFNYSSVPVKYSFKDNNWYYINVYDGSSNDYVFQLNNNIITAYRTFQAYPPMYSIGNYQANTVYFSSSSTVATLHSNDGIFMGSALNNVYIFYPSGTSVWYWNAGNIGFTAYSVCYDKYGNMVFGGEGGKVIVRDAGGALQTNTDFYTEYVVNIDIKQGVNNAVNAANNAATQAQNAANNTWYNGQSAAYWANMAANNTASLVANFAPAINKVQGQNSATCTTGSTFTLVISATPSSGVSYRVTCGPFDSGWTANNTITINSGIVTGANVATVQVKNAAGTTAQTTFTFFKV